MKELLRGLSAPVLIYKQQISENEIIQLQDLFLTPGLHRLSFSDLLTARTHFYRILDSLAFYQCPTVISSSSLSVRADLQLFDPAALADKLSADAVGAETLEACLMAYLDCDFLWIEATTHLRGSDGWLKQVMALVDQLHLTRALPVCLVETLVI